MPASHGGRPPGSTYRTDRTILDAFRRWGSLSFGELVKETGLARGTVSSWVRRFRGVAHPSDEKSKALLCWRDGKSRIYAALDLDYVAMISSRKPLSKREQRRGQRLSEAFGQVMKELPLETAEKLGMIGDSPNILSVTPDKLQKVRTALRYVEEYRDKFGLPKTYLEDLTERYVLQPEENIRKILERPEIPESVRRRCLRLLNMRKKQIEYLLKVLDERAEIGEERIKDTFKKQLLAAAGCLAEVFGELSRSGAIDIVHEDVCRLQEILLKRYPWLDQKDLQSLCEKRVLQGTPVVALLPTQRLETHLSCLVKQWQRSRLNAKSNGSTCFSTC